MGIEPRVWLCAGSRNGPCINKRCINVTLNRATSGLFIWPHLQESTRCPPAGPWGDRVHSLLHHTAQHRKMFVSFTKHGRFQFSTGQISCCKLNTTIITMDIWGFPLHKVLGRDVTHLHKYEVRGLINSHVCGLEGQLSHFHLAVYKLYTTSVFAVSR